MNPPGDPLFSVGQRVYLKSAPGLVRAVTWRVWSVNRKQWVYKVDDEGVNHPESELLDAPADDARRLVTYDDLDSNALREHGFGFEMANRYQIMKCPGCARIRLEDGEWLFAWLEPDGPLLSCDPAKPDACSCGRSFCEPLAQGVNATLAYGVTRDELAKSAWRWICADTRQV